MVIVGKNNYELSGPLVWTGFKQLVPISMFATTTFGAAFGLAAVQAGLDGTAAVAMSALVFAGAAQFGALDMWGHQVPLFTLMVTVFAINARHLLMGATLYPYMVYLPPHRRYSMMLVASDANWAMSMQAFARGRPGFGLLLGGGLALWSFWILGTWLGVVFGGIISDPEALGLDAVMACFLFAIMLGGDKSLRMLTIWAIAALASLGAYRYLPENSHVVVGALAGGIAGTLLKAADDEH